METPEYRADSNSITGLTLAYGTETTPISTGVIAVMCDRRFGTLLAHGPAKKVEERASTSRNAFRRAGLPADDLQVVRIATSRLVADPDALEVLNKAIATVDYARIAPWHLFQVADAETLPA